MIIAIWHIITQNTLILNTNHNIIDIRTYQYIISTLQNCGENNESQYIQDNFLELQATLLFYQFSRLQNPSVTDFHCQIIIKHANISQ